MTTNIGETNVIKHLEKIEFGEYLLPINYF